MYAIVQASGRQYRIAPGDMLEVNRLAGEPGDTVTLEDSVLMVNKDGDLQMGNPTVDGVTVDLEIVDHYRGKKLIVFKMKRRKRHRRKNGHRQELTKVTVKNITLPGDVAEAAVSTSDQADETEA